MSCQNVVEELHQNKTKIHILYYNQILLRWQCKRLLRQQIKRKRIRFSSVFDRVLTF